MIKMMKTFLLLLSATTLIGCDFKDKKRDVYLLCEGSISYGKILVPNGYEVRSSFYIGKDFVEQEGTKYLICEEKKTDIRFSDDCKETKQTEGHIDLVAKTVDVDETLKRLPNRQRYECKVEKNPRY